MEGGQGTVEQSLSRPFVLSECYIPECSPTVLESSMQEVRQKWSSSRSPGELSYTYSRAFPDTCSNP